MNKNEIAQGAFAALLATAAGILLLTSVMSDKETFESIAFLYEQKKLGGFISLAALPNLAVFFIAIRRQKIPFATGVLIFSMLLVVIVATLKIIG